MQQLDERVEFLGGNVFAVLLARFVRILISQLALFVASEASVVVLQGAACTLHH